MPKTFTEYLERKLIYDLSGGKCHICNQPVSFDEFEKEHVFPKSLGGSNSPVTNIRAAHQFCNSQKSDDLTQSQPPDALYFMEFAQKLGLVN